MKFHHERLASLISAIFASSGCNAQESDAIADHLVKANLAGHDSHGVIRAPIYIQWMSDEKVFANRDMEVIIDSPTMALIDGQMGFGQWIGKQATQLGIDKCRDQGVAVIALRNSGHLGRIGHWSEMAADANLVALNFVNTSGLGMHVVPAGGKDKRLSINPISVAFPVEGRSPVVLDFAAAATAEGKLKVARNKGVRVPEGWIVDADGNPTTDPNEFYGPVAGEIAGSILPLAGHKGYGLGFMAELLAGALTGGGASSAGKTRLEQNMLSILVDPLKLQAGGDLFAEARRYVDFVKSSEPSEPGGQVLAPGDIEDRNRQERIANGVELDEISWGQLKETAAACGVSPELADAAILS